MKETKNKTWIIVAIILVVALAVLFILFKDKIFTKKADENEKQSSTTNEKAKTNPTNFDKIIIDGVEFNLASINKELEENGWQVNEETSDELTKGNLAYIDYFNEQYGKGKDKFRITITCRNTQDKIIKPSEAKLDGLLIYLTKTTGDKKYFDKYPTIELNNSGNLNNMTLDEVKAKFPNYSQESYDDRITLSYRGDSNYVAIYFDSSTKKFIGLNLSY